jgi:hypothetical protein
MWRERGSRMALIVASQFQLSRCIVLAEYQEFVAATHFLTPFALHPRRNCVRQWGGYTYLQAGLLDQALTEFNIGYKHCHAGCICGRVPDRIAKPQSGRISGGGEWILEPRPWGTRRKYHAEAQGHCEHECASCLSSSSTLRVVR